MTLDQTAPLDVPTIGGDSRGNGNGNANGHNKQYPNQRHDNGRRKMNPPRTLSGMLSAGYVVVCDATPVADLAAREGGRPKRHHRTQAKILWIATLVDFIRGAASPIGKINPSRYGQIDVYYVWPSNKALAQLFVEQPDMLKGGSLVGSIVTLQNGPGGGQLEVLNSDEAVATLERFEFNLQLARDMVLKAGEMFLDTERDNSPEVIAAAIRMLRKSGHLVVEPGSTLPTRFLAEQAAAAGGIFLDLAGAHNAPELDTDQRALIQSVLPGLLASQGLRIQKIEQPAESIGK